MLKSKYDNRLIKKKKSRKNFDVVGDFTVKSTILSIIGDDNENFGETSIKWP